MLPFKPKFIPTLFTVPAFLVLIALGTWQVQRLQWKNSLVEEVIARSEKPATLYEGQEINIKNQEYQRFLLTGIFDHSRERHLYTGPKIIKGTPGYNLFTPLILASGSEVLVDRGWVPKDKKQQDKRPETLTEGEVTLETMLHKGETPGLFTPENDPARNLWFWVDVNAMLDKESGQKIYFRILKNKTPQTGFPLAGEASIEQRNDHLQYAITWYSLAIILIVIYVVFHMKAIREEK